MPKKITFEEFISRAKEKHNNKYDYSKSIYVGCQVNILIICPRHGEFQQWPTNHIRGNGCPECAQGLRMNHFIRKHSKYNWRLRNYVESLRLEK